MSVTSRFVAIDASLKNVSPIHGYESESLVSIEEALKDVESLINDLPSRIKVAREKCHFPSEHGLTQDESASIYIYTMEWGNSSLYRVLNKALRSKKRQALKTWFPYLKLFDVALNKLPGAKEVVWRGVPLDIGKDFIKNQTLTWWSINSCSSSVDVIKGFLGVDKKSTLFLIETCNGRKISGYTAHADEDEMILPIGSKFRVKSNSLDQSYGSHVVHLIEIDAKIDQSGALVMNQMKSNAIPPCKNSLDATEIFMSLRMDDVLECAMSILHTDSKLKGLIEKELQKLAVGDTGELFAIFYGSSMIANAKIDKPDEKEILYLLLNYLLSKIENEGETDETTKLFSFSDEQKNKMKSIFQLLKQWLVDLIIVKSIKKSSEQIQEIKSYATSLQKRLQNLQGICILPSGFAKVTWNTSNFSNFLMLESEYTGPHSTASIIEFKSKKYKHLTQIDPISLYDRSFRELTADKISLGLEIKKIPPENFDDNFFLLLMTLRIIAASESYESSYLYEIVLSKLGEHFVFSIAQHNGFRNWYSNEKYDPESTLILIRVALLYYNCSAIITSELFPDEKFSYEPTYYTKLVLVLFGLLAMVDDLVRNDKTVGSSLTNYTLSTELWNISLKSVLPQIALPERKWFCLLNNIKLYFNLSATNTEKSIVPGKFLFHYSSLSMENDSDKNNIDVIFMLNVLKNNFTGNYKKFEETFKEVKVDELKNKWQELLFSDKYIPESLRHLRDITYLSQLSLFGFSVRAIKKIKSPEITSRDTYRRFKFSCSASPSISALEIDMKGSADKWRFVDFTLPKNRNKYQRLIASDFDQKNNISMSENEIIGTQSEKPDNLSRPQYYRLNSIQLYDDLKFTLIYIALKNDEINFETEEHCYLVKQVLHKVGICEERCLLEKQFQNENFATVLVKKFIEIVLDLQERIVQYKSIGHALDILIYLYAFCSDNAKQLIDRCLEGLRVAVLKYINEKTMTSNIKNRQDVESILSCYYILTFKNSVMIDEKQVSQILKLRILIDNNSKLYGFIPASLYTKTMISLFELSSKIESVIDKNLSMLDGYVSSSHGSWKKDASMNFYVKDSYSFLHLKGRLFHNGHPLVCFPDQIFNNSQYKECFGIQNFLVEGVDRNVFGQILRCYETKRKESENFRITCLGGNNIWIENKNETFVPKTYLSKLPRFLLQNSTHFDNDQTVYYSHWWNENKIYIRNHDKKILKDENKNAEFTIDLKTNEIYSNEHKKYLIPFVKDGFDQSNVLYSIFSRFEDQNYILALKDREQDSEPVMIFLSRLNLKFKLSGTKVISEDFKDYCLSPDQHIDTLFGLSQYLVLEPDIQHKFPIRFNRKIIIAYHPIEKKPFYSNIIQFNLNKVGKPAYFSYEIAYNGVYDFNLNCAQKNDPSFQKEMGV
ncbi:unnamed protein product [Rotaria socialis]|uniref:NAD(P)(+)--arginine ADP-ribosyltransferase n=1 Tax=Rotaria socialis TaxID=392032 RepID=A0A817WJC8_9BILA|nr:unnamed protein product [Rotaria socialis]